MEYGLIGAKLGHSYSKIIHEMLCGYHYDLCPLPTEEEARAFLAKRQFKAINVTIPYKKLVMEYCSYIDPRAKAIGAVNTVVNKNGLLYGYNTDYMGFAHLCDAHGVNFAGRTVLILGTGGTHNTTWAVAHDRGAKQIYTVSRQPDPEKGELTYAQALTTGAQIIINTTPVGMYPGNGDAPVDLHAFPRCRGVLDVIYNPHRTALLLQAQALGIPCSDGLAMLVAQAKAAEEHFFSRPIPDGETERILSALRHETENIVLIGMPGCGKSTVGAALAALTGREAVDIDAEIERRAGCTIPEIFARGGEAAFRRLEHQATAEAGKRTGCILLTGGGAVKTPENYGALRQNGRIYHLLRDVGALPTDGRPLSQGADLAAMWRERKPLYERFRDVVIDNNGPAEETARAIWRDFCAYSGD